MRFIFINLYIGKWIKKLNSYQRVRNTGKVTYTQFAEIQSPCLNDNIPLSLRRRTLKSYMFYDTLPGFNILKTCISAECIKNIPPSCILEFYVSLWSKMYVCMCVCVCVCGPFIVLLKADSSMLHPVVVLVESYIYIYVQKEYTKFREIAQLSIGFVYYRMITNK